MSESTFDSVYEEYLDTLQKLNDLSVQLFSLSNQSLIFSGRDYPKTNIVFDKDNQQYIYEFSIPGFSKEELELKIEDGILVFSGKQEKNHFPYEKKEISNRSFKKKISLPKNVNEDNIKVQLSNGILTVLIPSDSSNKKTIVLPINEEFPKLKIAASESKDVGFSLNSAPKEDSWEYFGEDSDLNSMDVQNLQQLWQSFPEPEKWQLPNVEIPEIKKRKYGLDQMPKELVEELLASGKGFDTNNPKFKKWLNDYKLFRKKEKEIRVEKIKDSETYQRLKSNLFPNESSRLLQSNNSIDYIQKRNGIDLTWKEKVVLKLIFNEKLTNTELQLLTCREIWEGNSQDISSSPIHSLFIKLPLGNTDLGSWVLDFYIYRAYSSDIVKNLHYIHGGIEARRLDQKYGNLCVREWIPTAEIQSTTLSDHYLFNFSLNDFYAPLRSSKRKQEVTKELTEENLLVWSQEKRGEKLIVLENAYKNEDKLRNISKEFNHILYLDLSK